jgi:hypothetical protein
MPRQLGMFLCGLVLSDLWKLAVASVMLINELQEPSAATLVI